MKVILGLFSIIVYCAIGMLFHWMIIGDQIDVASTASWAVIIAWPFVLMVIIFAFGLAIAICVLAWIIGSEIVNGYQRAAARKKQ